jgi:uncharacterized protein YqcC (DUF446 family)
MKYQHTARLLQQIESELKALQLWSTEKPSTAAFASTAPFACDFMTLEQWLQFIFLPSMQMLIETQQPLPVNCSIYPMAEIAWVPLTAGKQPLLTHLQQLDLLLSNITLSGSELI